MKFQLGTNYESKLHKKKEFVAYLRSWQRRFVLWPTRLNVDGQKNTYAVFQWVYVSYPDAMVCHYWGKPAVWLGRAMCVEKLPSD